MKKCVVCNVELQKRSKERPSAFVKRKLCSLKCRQKYLVQKKLDKFIFPICKNCNKTIKVRDSRRKFCDDRCFREWNRGANCAHWKGGVKKHGKYLQNLVGKNHFYSDYHGYIMQHRVVLEDFLRRQNPDSEFLVEINGEKYLRPDVKVHHKDHNKHNNDIRNLEPFFTQKEHFHYNFCPQCPHCNKSDELLESPEKDNQQPS